MSKKRQLTCTALTPRSSVRSDVMQTLNLRECSAGETDFGQDDTISMSW